MATPYPIEITGEQSFGQEQGLRIHHIQPRSRLSNDATENLIALCASCHQKAHWQS